MSKTQKILGIGVVVILLLIGTLYVVGTTEVVLAPEAVTGESQSLPVDSDTLNRDEELGEIPSQEESAASASPSQEPQGLPDTKPTACTMDAKMCADGSYVGRTAPHCDFAACPNEVPPNSRIIVCSEEMENADVCADIYQPVCGLVQVQCITTPCNPVPETFSNACSACARGNVTSYTEGTCTL